jgi:hypothetical protein
MSGKAARRRPGERAKNGRRVCHDFVKAEITDSELRFELNGKDKSLSHLVFFRPLEIQTWLIVAWTFSLS